MLALTVITRDEADRIERCIRSVPLATEVIVVDSGSADDTVARAAALGARVVQTDWPGFVPQKNRAWSLATQPWVLSLDADEWLSPEAVDAIRAAIASDTVDGLRFVRRSRWLGHPIRHGRWGRDRPIRLARRDRARFVGDEPHDRLAVDGPVSDVDAVIHHDPYRSVAEHFATVGNYAALSSGSTRGPVSGWTLAWRPLAHAVDAIVLRQGWRDGPPGLAVAWVGAAGVALKWAAAWARQQR